MGKEKRERSKETRGLFYKQRRKERIRELSKNFTEDLNTLILEKDGIVDQTKATKEVVMMELEIEKSEAEIAERRWNMLMGFGSLVITGLFMYGSYKFNCRYMNMVFNQKDSLNVVDPKSFNALTRSKDNFGRLVENNMRNSFRKGGRF